MKAIRTRIFTPFRSDGPGSAMLLRVVTRYAPVVAGLVVVAAALLGHTLQLSARTHDGAPTGLTAKVVEGGIALSWEAPRGEEAIGYRILRRYATDEPKLEVLVEDTGSAHELR